jgi:hypothetical protein
MSEKTKAVETPLATLLDEVLKFCRIQDQLMSRALAEASAQEQFLAAVELRSATNTWLFVVRILSRRFYDAPQGQSWSVGYFSFP